MSLEHAPQRQTHTRKSVRYLTKRDLQQRYGWKTGLSVTRNWKIYKTIPAPTIYLGRKPMWDAAILDAHDAQTLRTSTVVLSKERIEAITVNLDRARKVRAKKIKQRKRRVAK
jgi:hypothetical protein